MGEPLQVTFRVNGRAEDLVLDPRSTLLDVLRDTLALTGAKRVCDMGDCGACTVILDGRAVYACLVLGVECDGAEVRTVEGLATEADGLDPVQQAFVDCDALQCGFCTPGQVMSLRALLDARPAPTDAELLRAMSGNLCRCGAYANILAAARQAAAAAPRP